ALRARPPPLLARLRVVREELVGVDGADLAVLAVVERDLRAAIVRNHPDEDAGVVRLRHPDLEREDEARVLAGRVEQAARVVRPFASADRVVLDAPGGVAVV